MDRFALEGIMTLEEADFDQPTGVCLKLQQQRSFEETAASMRRAFEDLRAAEDAIERQLAEIRVHIGVCGLMRRVARSRAA